MKYTTAKQGRIFIVRLEDGEFLQDSIEQLALRENIKSAYVQVVGGADKDSILITGPEKGRAKKIQPMHSILDEMHEIVGNGTIFSDKDGKPVLHMHIACGREDNTICGEIRNGVKIWHIAEIIIVELLDNNSTRVWDETTGFDFLIPK